MIALKKILVATDFSEPSDAALAYGRELARSFGAKLTVLYVVEDVLTRAYGIDGGVVMSDPDVQAQIEHASRKQIDALISSEDRRELKADAVLVVSNTPAAAIVSYARDAASDLIVMGTHGRGGVAHLLMGSVAEKVLRLAPCPVLAVKP